MRSSEHDLRRRVHDAFRRGSPSSETDLLKDADIALYAAKAKNRGQIAIFRPEMRAEAQQRASKISLAQHALQNDLIVPFYQPKVELTSGKVIGFEALLRWRHPTLGVQMPASIDAAFEDLELARRLTDRMLTQVVTDVRGWLDAGLDFGHVAVTSQLRISNRRTSPSFCCSAWSSAPSPPVVFRWR